MTNDTSNDIPWYQRAIRWGQTNLTEMDPIYCNMEWWKEYWLRTRVQGIIVNAGGIVAYYPSSFELHYRAKGLGDHDLFGDFVFYGRGEAGEKVSLPWHGFVRALTRARIPFVPVHADHITREAENLDVLILPDLAVMTDQQCQAVRDFVEAGGSLVFTGASATLNEWGEVRREFPLESITGIRHHYEVDGAVKNQTSDWAFFDTHNYFRLPEDRHPSLSGFENTDIVPFGGQFHRVEASEQMRAIATYIPAFPIYPPEFSWMREPRTDIPAVLAGKHASGGRIFYFAGDVDRCYGRTHLPDLGDLLASAVKWTAEDKIPLKVEGPGYLDCKLYRQSGRLILHLINLSGTNQNPGYVEEFLPVGPIIVSVKTDSFVPKYARLKVRGIEIQPEINNYWATFQVDSLIDHEFIILEQD